MGGLYYRVALDDRDLNYDKYFTLGDEGEGKQLAQLQARKTRDDLPSRKLLELLLSLPEVRAELSDAR